MSQESRDEERKDTYVSHSSYQAAIHMAGAVCHSVDIVAGPDRKFRHAFCAGRPPGHHAGREGHTQSVDTQGYCLINNICIGGLYAIQKYGYKRVLLFDFDVHHGNGTEDIASGNPNMMFISMHVAEIYPNTGSVGQESGSNILHVPIPNGCTSKQYRKQFNELVPKIDAYAPDLILLSAGFDAHKNDPTKSAKLTLDDFIFLTCELKRLADKHCDGKLISALEGGYNLEHLAKSVQVHIMELMRHSKQSQKVVPLSNNH